MKKLILIPLFFALVLFGCDQNKKDQTSENMSKNNSNKKVNVASKKQNSNNVLPEINMKDQNILAKAEKYDGSFDSDVILMTRSNSEDYSDQFDDDDVSKLKLPDGNMWAVKKEDGKSMLVMPDDELIQEKQVNGNIILITDDGKTYEVRKIGHNLVAVRNQEINVATN